MTVDDQFSENFAGFRRFRTQQNEWRYHYCQRQRCKHVELEQFLADRTNGRAYATVLRPSVVCLSVTLCAVAKRCVLEQKLLLTAYTKSYMKNRLVPKWMTLTFV